MAGENQENSFEEYKKYLVESIGESGISRPPRVMNPFQIFCFERQSKERKEKGKLNLIQFNKTLSEEWKSLSDSKKEYYQKVYEIRKSEFDDIKIEYDLLTNRTKSPSAYIIYYRKRYPVVSQQQKTAGEAMITKMIAADWANLSPSMKSVYEQQAQIQKKKRSLDADEKKELIQVYEDKVKVLKQKILEDKQKILKKYELFNLKNTKQKNKKHHPNTKNQKNRQTQVKKQVPLVSQPKQSQPIQKVKLEEEAKKAKRSKSQLKSMDKQPKGHKKEIRSKSEPPKSKEAEEEKVKLKKDKSSSKQKTSEKKTNAKKKIIKKTQKTSKTIKFQSILPKKNRK